MNESSEFSDTTSKQKTGKASQQKILLVDDDPAIRRILMRLLTEEDYLVEPAANGAEALTLAEGDDFDLVLLDLNMPVKDGWETYQQMSVRYPTLPIVLITAKPNQFFPALASGVGALLEKPLDMEKLFSTIRQLLKESAEVRKGGKPSVFRYVTPVSDEAENK
jgi:DNA-binding response OmpR family regulator